MFDEVHNLIGEYQTFLNKIIIPKLKEIIMREIYL